jgi:hypothetical protein
MTTEVPRDSTHPSMYFCGSRQSRPRRPRPASCYALSRYTACVFHLMRLLEYGLASLADSLAVPIANPNWHHVLQGCEGKIKDLIKHDPDWKDNEQFYNAAALEFRHFQRALRNHTAHAKDMYSQATPDQSWTT